MTRKFKSIAALFLSGLALVSLNSCLSDDDNDSEQKSKWYTEIVNTSLGRYNAKYSLTLAGQAGGAEQATYYDLKQDDKKVPYIEIPNFPLKDFAASIEVPTVTATAGSVLYDKQVARHDSIQALKTALENATPITVKAQILTNTNLIAETFVQFVAYAPVSFELSYAAKTGGVVRNHKYVLSQEGGSGAAFGETPKSILKAVNGSHSVLNINLIYYSLRDVTNATTGGTLAEFTPTQLYYAGN